MVLTAYDTIFAKLADDAEVDIILVGDSVGTTMLGMDDTVRVTLEHIVHHCAAAARGISRALLVADVPFAVAHMEEETLLRACMRLMQEGGARAVKIEGGADRAQAIARCVQAGIPVMGHIGLQPQQVHALGGYRKFGKQEDETMRLVEDARALEQAGVFAIVAEMMTPEATAQVCEAVGVPVIGIGCSHPADGQVLVCTDLLGLGQGYIPSFVKQYAQLGDQVREAYRNYAEEVRKGLFPQ